MQVPAAVTVALTSVKMTSFMQNFEYMIIYFVFKFERKK